MRTWTRSALTSIFTTALDVGTLTGLVELFHVNYVLATFLGTVIGFISNFTINRYWAFEAHSGPIHWQFVRVLPVQAGSSGLQTLGVWLVTAYVRIPYFWSKLIVATLVYLLWNYPLNRHFVFGKAVRSGAPAKTSPLAG